MSTKQANVVGFYVISMSNSSRISSFFENPDARFFEVFEAVDGHREDISELFDIPTFRSRYCVDPKPGEMGCCLSHYKIMSQLVEDDGIPDDSWVVVAEDDARFVASFGDRLRNILASCCRNADYIVLGDWLTGLNSPISAIEPDRSGISFLSHCHFSPSNSSIFRKTGYIVPSDFYGAVAYAVRKRGARIILNISQDGKPYWKADDHRLFHEHGLRIYRTFPTMAQTSDPVGTIGNGYRETRQFEPTLVNRLRLNHRRKNIYWSYVSTRSDISTRIKRFRLR